MVGVFSETSFRQWQVSANSLGYILQLWVRLVAAVPYVGEGSNEAIIALKACVMRVVVAYVESMLQSCSACLEVGVCHTLWSLYVDIVICVCLG